MHPSEKLNVEQFFQFSFVFGVTEIAISFLPGHDLASTQISSMPQKGAFLGQ